MLSELRLGSAGYRMLRRTRRTSWVCEPRPERVSFSSRQARRHRATVGSAVRARLQRSSNSSAGRTPICRRPPYRRFRSSFFTTKDVSSHLSPAKDDYSGSLPNASLVNWRQAPHLIDPVRKRPPCATAPGSRIPAFAIIGLAVVDAHLTCLAVGVVEALGFAAASLATGRSSR